MSQKAQLVVEGKKLSVSNLDKVLYPKVGFTKGQVIDYFIRVAPVLLPVASTQMGANGKSVERRQSTNHALLPRK